MVKTGKGRKTTKAAKKAVKGAEALGAAVEQPEVARPTKENATHRALLVAGFQYSQSATTPEGGAAHGYVHKDGRAVLVRAAADGSEDVWTIKLPLGAGETGGAGTKLLRAALVSAKKAAAAAKTTARKVAHKEAQAEARKAAMKAAPPQEVTAVLRLVKKATGGTLAPRRGLQGDAAYGVRLRIAKCILGDEARAADAAVTALTKRLYVLLGVHEAAAATMEREFITLAKAALERAKKAEAAEAAEWKENMRRADLATLAQRTVAGAIHPAFRKKSGKQEAEERMALKAELEAKKRRGTGTQAPPAYDPAEGSDGAPAQGAAESYRNGSFEKATGYSPGAEEGRLATYAHGEAPAPDAAVPDAEFFRPAECALLEHKDTGIILLRLSLPGCLGGAPCVYNNGREVDLGIVNPERLAKFREIEKADVLTAARQLLKPIVSSVKISPRAERELTAVVHCKEIAPMATEIKTAKFAPPAKTATKKAAKNAEPKAAKAAKAAKSDEPKAAKPAKAEASKRAAKFTEDQKISAAYDKKNPPYREGSARRDLLLAAVEAGSVGGYLKKAGEPSGGSAHSYLNLFVKEGYLVVK